LPDQTREVPPPFTCTNEGDLWLQKKKIKSEEKKDILQIHPHGGSADGLRGED